VQNFFAFFLPE